jgi:D-serine deaminase-like pyridoxal phosphate-dependent protein
MRTKPLSTVEPPPELEPLYEQMRREYAGSIGRHRSELVTPALILELPAARRNIATMARAIADMPAELRPHIKVHKSPELARLQVEAGAIGLSIATVWEAVVLARFGLDHLFVVNTVAGAEKMRVLAMVATERDVMVAIDDADNAADLGSAARAAGSELGVLIEVDTGMDRCGVDTAEAALALARKIVGTPGLRFVGVTGYEGHCSLTPDRERRHLLQRNAMARLIGVAERFEQDGIPVPIRSAGGTATWDWTATYPGVTEIQAGTYVFMDAFHDRMVEGFEQALVVAATVISQPPGRLIIDAGSKAIGDGELSRIVGHPEPAVRFDEEHGVFAAEGSAFRIGDVVSVIPGYAASTVNWFDAYHVVDGDGIVQDIWPVIPRGPGHHGLIGG